jgi:hypothetical protein
MPGFHHELAQHFHCGSQAANRLDTLRGRFIRFAAIWPNWHSHDLNCVAAKVGSQPFFSFHQIGTNGGLPSTVPSCGTKLLASKRL